MFEFKTTPYKHQAKGFDLSKDAPYFALWMEQRTGKTKLTIDTAAYNYHAGRINGLVVVAPNGVHMNWAREEVPVHMPDTVPTRVLIWRSGKAATKSYQREMEELLKFRGLAILCMNVEATITKAGKAFLRKFLEKREALFAIDESTDIKTPGAKRTKAIKALGRLAKMRRILTGTPGKPMEQFSQITFLSPHILDTTSYTAYKQEYGIWEQRVAGENGRTFQVLTGHKNLDKLKQLLDPHVFRVTREEAFPGMPKKVYTKHFIELSREQKRMYDELRSEYLTQFPDGAMVSAPMTLVRYLRLQQIACGYVPIDEGFLQTAVDAGTPLSRIAENAQPERLIPGGNPRLDALRDILERSDGKVIIWCRFRPDIRLIMDMLGDAAVQYNGDLNLDEKEESKNRFQRGDAQYFVGNARAAGRGLDLSAADAVIYYSNYFGLETRQQSEDRAQSGKRKTSVLYTDIVAEGTVDERIIRALRNDQSLADLLTGDPSKEWI